MPDHVKHQSAWTAFAKLDDALGNAPEDSQTLLDALAEAGQALYVADLGDFLHPPQCEKLWPDSTAGRWARSLLQRGGNVPDGPMEAAELAKERKTAVATLLAEVRAKHNAALFWIWIRQAISQFAANVLTIAEPATAKSEATQHVTLDQMAAHVNRSKRTLERLKKRSNNPLPPPSVEGGGGKPDEWVWPDVRPWLEKEFKRKLPERFPPRGNRH